MMVTMRYVGGGACSEIAVFLDLHIELLEAPVSNQIIGWICTACKYG